MSGYLDYLGAVTQPSIQTPGDDRSGVPWCYGGKTRVRITGCDH